MLSRGMNVVAEDNFYRYLLSHDALPTGCGSIENADTDVKLVVSFGGDGTFLHAAQWVGSRRIPILGVNTGHLGFLASWMIDDANAIIETICRDEMSIERRSLLMVKCKAMPRHVWRYALNEVSILKENTASMITVSTRVDDFFLTDYLVDGLVISTPTGSTAYNLSAGGPILQPTLDAWVLSPIAPHTLTMRPLVIDARSVVTAIPSSRSGGCMVSIDGRSFSVPSDSEITLCRAPFPTLIARRHTDNFAATLRNKLLWGRTPRHDS